MYMTVQSQMRPVLFDELADCPASNRSPVIQNVQIGLKGRRVHHIDCFLIGFGNRKSGQFLFDCIMAAEMRSRIDLSYVFISTDIGGKMLRFYWGVGSVYTLAIMLNGVGGTLPYPIISNLFPSRYFLL